jgi:CRISPR-associated endonuclease/helicase Cas3
LHNIANSVIVLDEAQMIPITYLMPCIWALKELVTHYNSTVVLATATQSSLDEYFLPLTITEIVEEPKEMYEFFKRVTYEKLETPLSDEDIAAHIESHNQVLCIVNTRKRAQAIAELLGDDVYHLSTTMVPAHRTRVLAEIRRRLKHDETCKVISTSIIEAGVDVDFPAVYREKAGLDSVIQAAGRCNREGKERRENAKVYVFTTQDPAPPLIAQNIAAYEHATRNNDDIASLDAIKSYFEQVRYIIGNEGLDKKGILKDLKEGSESLMFPFRKISEEFKLIDNLTRAVIVPYNKEAKEFISRLRNGERSRELFRAVQKYSVSLYESDMREPLGIGDIKCIDENDKEIFVSTESYYNEQYGVSLSPKGGKALFADNGGGK